MTVISFIYDIIVLFYFLAALVLYKNAFNTNFK